ncbi:hypothetical protein OG828_44495 [Streptomyces sp. NBC_00457]|uniref:hypothetical protein n=1 Tax=unclassified Streptomyces TaxID=2593676 RepID=UPI002E20FD63|nr:MULTISPECIES: hypothetical protein [unclassified Streptomyces]
MNITVAVVLALASIAAYAAAATTQHRVASADGHELRHMLTSPAWWASNAAHATGAALHVTALKYRPLTSVQCLGALTVTAAVPLAARGAGRRVSRGERHGMALALAGFAAPLPLTATGGDSTGVLTTPSAVAVAVTASLVVLLALALAAASGIASGTGSALTRTVLRTDRLPTWQTAPVAVPAVALAVAVRCCPRPPTPAGSALPSPPSPWPTLWPHRPSASPSSASTSTAASPASPRPSPAQHSPPAESSTSPAPPPPSPQRTTPGPPRHMAPPALLRPRAPRRSAALRTRASRE